MTTIKLDWPALWDVINEQARGPVDDLATQIAARVDVGSVTDAEVGVRSDVTTSMRNNRVRAEVTIAHPAGLAIQAKHGALTKAAASVGLTVKARKSKGGEK